jgi:hypothetical protein
MLEARDQLFIKNRELEAKLDQNRQQMRTIEDEAATRETDLLFQLARARQQAISSEVTAGKGVELVQEKRIADLQSLISVARSAVASKDQELQNATDLNNVLRVELEQLGRIHVTKLGEAETKLLHSTIEVQTLREQSDRRERAAHERNTDLRRQMADAECYHQDENAMLTEKIRSLRTRLGTSTEFDGTPSSTGEPITPSPSVHHLSLRSPLGGAEPPAMPTETQIWRHM